MMPAASMEVTLSQHTSSQHTSPQPSPNSSWMEKQASDVTTQNADDVIDRSVASSTSSPSRPDSGMAIVLSEKDDSVTSPRQNAETPAVLPAAFKSSSPSQSSADSGIVSSSGQDESPTSSSSLTTSSSRKDASNNDSSINKAQAQRNLNLIACEECGLICAGQSHYQVHIRSHTGERPFKCTVCGVAFTQKGNLRRHYKIHSEEKPFQCPVCSYRCRRRDALNGHMRIHSDIRPYRCVYCARSYKSRQSLKEHEYQCVYKNDPIVQARQLTSSPAKGSFGDKRLSPLTTSQTSSSPISMTSSNLPIMQSQVLNPLLTSSSPNSTSSGKRKASNPQKFTRLSDHQQQVIPSLANALQYMPTLLTTMMQQHMNDTATAEQQRQQDEALDFSAKRKSGLQNTNGDTDSYQDNVLRHPRATTERLSGSARRKRPKYLNEKIEQNMQGHESSFPSKYDVSPTMNSLDLSGQSKNDDMTSFKSDVRSTSPFAHVRSGDASRSGLRVFSSLGDDSEIEELKTYICSHCRCIFLDHVMFAIHVGCHGFRDPLECNVCGHLAADRYQFQSHLARGEHNLGGKVNDVTGEKSDYVTDDITNETSTYQQSSTYVTKSAAFR
uniref:Putative Ikaros-related protein 1 n=1 Tax=Ciona intestinalis TaxID=7719 RepID=Q4H2G8_CIOIN|nr:zinc finger protein [Ciona intestinalis]BAE06809.1 zinc finger protein [Ciona intestinalis]CAQ76712.1 TPA: putative Ikaros-related protein 1 [Ciona intestinalis]|eukprot:NP_001071878.1 zinc finger protein [Ciona intestinalis]